MKIPSLVLTFFFTCLNVEAAIENRNGFKVNGANVCKFVDQVSRRVQITLRQTTLTKGVAKSICGILISRTCYRSVTITKSYMTYAEQTKYFDRNNYHCCTGWVRKDKDSDECTKPVCSLSCRNGGNCTAPDTCVCPEGFAGKYCQLDVDECRDINKNKCEQVCTNLKGGMKCSCKKGYLLNDDGRTCKDENECNRFKSPCRCAVEDGVCKAGCINTPGSFHCNCSKGYRLDTIDQCRDINECHKLDQCDQKCVNLPGSYRCECFKGFVYNGTKCVDRDECAINNGGCSDSCHNVVGGHVCSCPDRFYLDKDRRTCKVLEPSMTNKVVCQSDGVGFLTCDKVGETLIIVDAMYGRLTSKICQSGNYTQNVRCQANVHDTLTRLQTVCNGKSSCVFFFEEKVFGDPCPGIEKYMQVIYNCKKN